MSDDEKYLQEINCERCQTLLGYAPYYSTEYKCVQCNGTVTDSDFRVEALEEGKP